MILFNATTKITSLLFLYSNDDLPHSNLYELRSITALRSSQIKICKPDPNAYLTACSAIGVLPTEVYVQLFSVIFFFNLKFCFLYLTISASCSKSIMCDDLRENLVTATNLGMGTVLFDINKDKRKAIGELMSLLNGHHRISSKL